MFKESFRYYKSKNPPPLLDNVLDLHRILDLAEIRVINKNYGEIKQEFGLKSPVTWEVYEIRERPGLIFIKNPFTCMGQRCWTIRCLQDYSKKPNKTNIDVFNLVPENEEWWDMCQSNSDKLLLNKLRWVTLGYYHNWDTKVYSEEDKGVFPKDLSDMTAYIANILGFSNFSAEAAIVNYYHMDSTLLGHTDHSEQNLDAPLFSYSFGQSAIFLIGGKTKDEKPTPIFLKSGDIIIMTGESRLAYHGVPKIWPAEFSHWNFVDEGSIDGVNKEYEKVVSICKDENLWKLFADYLSHSRININVRQVLNRGKKRLYNEESENVS